MDQPYVLAKVHKAGADSAARKIYAGTTHVGQAKISSREIVTAVDSHGISIYNLRSNQLVNSYSLSPSTKFHCAPISVLDRLSSTRQTYAALQTGVDSLRVERWLESGAAEETQTCSYNIKEAVRALHFLDDRLVLIYQSGNIELLSSDLSVCLERIETKTYAGHEPLTVLADWARLSSLESHSIDINILLGGSTITMHKLRLTFSEDSPECEILNSQVDVQLDRPSGLKEESLYAVCGEQGQFLIIEPSSQEILLNVYNEAGSRTNVLRIPVSKVDVSRNPSVRWLTSTQLLISLGANHSIWDLNYEIQLESLTTDTDTDVIAIVPQKSGLPSAMVAALLVLSNVTQISVSRINYSMESNLLNVIEKRANASSTSQWIQDVDLQSTWKDSLSHITASAKRSLSEIAKSSDGFEIDTIMANLLFPGQKTSLLKLGASDQSGHNGLHPTNGHVINGTTGHHSNLQGVDSDEDSERAESLVKDKKHRIRETNQRFATYDTDISLSTSFVTKAIHFIFDKLLVDEKHFTIPSATLDYLLKKGLVSLASPHDEVIVKNLTKLPADLYLRFISDVPGLLPMQLFTVLESVITSHHVKVILGPILSKLELFDDSLVISAIRARIPSDHIYTLLKMFSDELEHRNADSEYKNELQVTDHALCSAVTTFIDAVGVSNLIFTAAGAQLLSSLRSSVSNMIAQSDHIGSTAHCISELLMKARIADKVKVVSAEERALESNPEPQQKKSSLPLDKVKKQPKNLSARAKAHAVVQGIGSVYTIETLQI